MVDKYTLEGRVVNLIKGKIGDIESQLLDADGNWAVRGFVDVYRSVFPMTSDTKVLSKVMEMLLIPIFLEAISDLPLSFEFAEQQNHYPDLTVVDDATGARVALDLKSTYLVSPTKVNGFTLGAFTGYFRERTSTKNVLYPYGSYEAHLVFGVVYSKRAAVPEGGRYSLDEIESIPSVAGNFQFIVQPKWAIATTRPGSGNTKNIGSITDLDALIKGQGPFTTFDDPEAVFDDYWMHYLTGEMARAAETIIPYRNLAEYKAFKTIPGEA